MNKLLCRFLTYQRKLILIQVFEALWNDEINFTREDWADLVESGLDSSSIHGKPILFFGKLPDLMRRGKQALQVGDEQGLEILRCEAQLLRSDFAPILDHFRCLVEDHGIVMKLGHLDSHNLSPFLHWLITRSYAMALTLSITLNLITNALWRENKFDTTDLSNQILILSEKVVQYQPLGSMYMALFLGFAWVGASDSRPLIKAALDHYSRHCLGYSSSFISEVGLEWMAKRFSLAETQSFVKEFEIS